MNLVASFFPRAKVWVECSKEGLMDWSRAAEYWWAVMIALASWYGIHFFLLKKEPRAQEAHEQVDWKSLQTFLKDGALEEVTLFKWSEQGPCDTGVWLWYQDGNVVRKQIHADKAEIISVTVRGVPTCEVTYKNGKAILLTCAGLKQQEFSAEQHKIFKKLRDNTRRHANFSTDEISLERKGDSWPFWSS